MEFKKDWNFENDHKLWVDIVRKSFSELKIQSSKQNFHYPFEQQWSNQTCLNEREEKVTHPKLVIKNISLSESVQKKLNIDKTISEKKTHKYHCNLFLHHARGMDGNWEVVFALYDFLNLCQTGKIKKTIEILSVVDHNFFYQQVKNLSLVIMLKHILKAFHIRLPINVDIAVSDRMFTNTDPKNNLVRLTYALQAALLLRPRYILQSPLKGFSTEESWRLVSQAFNVLCFESDLLKTSNPYAGAVFFENAVVQFCHKVWEDLQFFLKLPNDKKRQGFYRDIVSNFMKDRKNKYLDKKIKVVGVNDFISPGAQYVNNKNDNDVHFFEVIRHSLEKKIKSFFSSTHFCFTGDKSKINHRLNEIYQLFAFINIPVLWEKYDASYKNVVLVLHETEQNNDFMKHKNIFMLFMSDQVVVNHKKVKRNIVVHNNPYTFWTDFKEMLK